MGRSSVSFAAVLAIAFAACSNTTAERGGERDAGAGRSDGGAGDGGIARSGSDGGRLDGDGSAAPATLPPRMVEASKILSKAGGDTELSWKRIVYLTDTFGHRLGGSESLERAIDWGLEMMGADGLANVRREKVMVPHWVRGEEAARVVAPVEHKLHITTLGGSVGTGGKALRGEVEIVGSLDEIDTRAEELKGKIVVINQAMPPYNHDTHESGYGKVASIRYHGARRAGKVGAIAVLNRSLTARSLQTPHTGSMSYGDDEKAPRIPAAALTLEDTELLVRLRKRGPVTIELSLGAKMLPDAESGNAIGEIRGRELPDEVVVLGCHIDSWDMGTGAQDDGTGCVMVLEAMRLLKAANLIPRRTLRAVLFTNEENGMRGAHGYFEAHGEETHAAAMESDIGAGEPYGFGVTGPPEQIAALKRYAPLFTELGASHIAKGFAGVDILPLTRSGVLGVGVHPDTSTYFDIHHSPADTVDKVNPEYLQRNAAAMALMAFVLAER